MEKLSRQERDEKKVSEANTEKKRILRESIMDKSSKKYLPI